MTYPSYPGHPDLGTSATEAEAGEIEALRKRLAQLEVQVKAREILSDLGYDPDQDQTQPNDQQHEQEPTMEPTTTPTPNQGSLDDQIAEAETAGDWFKAGMLKVEKGYSGSSETASQTAVAQDDDLAQRIAEAEAKGDFFTSGMLKVEATNRQRTHDGTAPTPASTEDHALEQRVTDAEARGDWGESLRLKAQRQGVRL